MPQRLSSVLLIEHSALQAAGVYDRFLEIDSLLHVDPHLLAKSGAPEMQAAAQTVEKFWADTIVILRNIKTPGDAFWRQAIRRFHFPENQGAGLGYAKGSTVGPAVSGSLTRQLAQTAQEIVAAGITDPKVFELIGVFEPNVGPDVISDIAIRRNGK
jgi:hypothetical protein